MSVVCCRVYEDRIEIASDSITVRGWTQEKGRDNHSKLVAVNDMVIGSVGRAEDSSLMQLFCATHKPEGASESDILSFMVEFLDWKKKKTDQKQTSGVFILLFEGKAFYINGFFIKEVVSYEAIGAGMDFALSALYLGHNVEKAVETACELSVMCEKPIQSLKMDKAGKKKTARKK
ncbi:MAG TPA: hypothetical protein PKV71_10255 [Calditrichia bacterium]|nr:hypothetical protein [Calditrichota bacterium]HQU73805.1 hypothetical protein [Calditrichia bacterium]HQV32249.1 hypothetical protein [Calditrichia bacterium]